MIGTLSNIVGTTKRRNFRRNNVNSSLSSSLSMSAVVLLLSLQLLLVFQITSSTITTTDAFTGSISSTNSNSNSNSVVIIPTTRSLLPRHNNNHHHHHWRNQHWRNNKLYAHNDDNETAFLLLSKIKTSSSESNNKSNKLPSSSSSSSKTITEDETKDSTSTSTSTRRSALLSTAKLASTALLTLSIIANPSFANAGTDDDDDDDDGDGEVITTTTTTTPISASWKAVDGLNTQDGNNNFISFDSSAYKAMINDDSRTPIFYKTIEERINQMDKESSDKIVVDLGTGPYAVFAIKAAECGAKKVYAIEANAKAAQMAKDTIAEKGYNDIITVIEGYSTDITLPNNDKADLIIAEIIGSIVSEEGCVTTILDASKRFAKKPFSNKTWIPQRVQTYGCPASYTLHNLFTPPSFDWSKLNGEPVRFNCRDDGLQLLCNVPQLIEDIDFSNIQKQYSNNNNNNNNSNKKQHFTFQVNENCIINNKDKLIIELQNNKLRENEANKIAEQTSNSFSGIAFWPRLILNDNDNDHDNDHDNNGNNNGNNNEYTINSRSYPNGEHQKSHWQTVLPIMNDIPIIVNGNSKIDIDININIDLNNNNNNNNIKSSASSPSYKIDGNVITTTATTPTPTTL